MRAKLFPLSLLPGFVLCGLLIEFHDARIKTTRTQFTAEELEAAKESIALSLMGQIQFTAHSLIWMKTLEYLHYGVALRTPTAAEERRGFRAREATDVASGLAHKCGVPVALSDEMDWRGPVGRLHRAVMPHMQIHRHSDPVELIPWYQLTLKLNPNLERLYTLSAFFMADFAGEPQEARSLLEAGVKTNPWTFEIRAALGRLLFDYHQQLGLAPTTAYEKAAEALREAIAYGKEEKARIEKAEGRFDAYQDQLFYESYLFLAKSLTELERYDNALAVCDEGYEITKHNLLNVQRRITTKRMSGE
ncbi:MAG TPA: hypothetical protein PKI11_06215 [Candidatus Hydrogenedentes bacterium]|nr:hypothetical protein [Candidatus Hydrogenedentota bacterium]